MIEILQSLDSRELASAIWLGIFIVWCLTKPGVREGFGSVLSAATARPIVIAFFLAIAHLVAVTAILCHFDLWTLKQFKITALWLVVAGIPALADTPEISRNPSLLKTAVAKNFKWSLLLDFFIKLPLLGELIYVPFTALLGGLLAVAQSDDTYAPAHKFLNGVLIVMGLGFLVFESYKVLTSFDTIANLDTLRDFVLPVIYNIAFIPLLWIMSIYIAYESVFVRLRFVIKDETLHSYARRKLITSFRADIGALNAWYKEAWSGAFTSRSDVAQSIAVIEKSRDTG
ncbi:hypothetical protein [Burkholderia multivorans]|uniref:hypothetical protein n=1 Tax=Burkholderia multivorans TaxID=87883 RepID=UPI0011B24F42|nr:hypothetical protein [Burkholderia multivorans]